MKTIKMFVPVVAMLFFGLFVQGQEIDSDPLDPHEFYQVEFFKFDPDKADDAKRILGHYFSIANELAGFSTPVMELELSSEDYNYMVVWEIKEDAEHLNWQTCPTNDEWYNALVTVAGSEEKARELIVKYDSYVQASKTEFARRN